MKNLGQTFIYIWAVAMLAIFVSGIKFLINLIKKKEHKPVKKVFIAAVVVAISSFVLYGITSPVTRCKHEYTITLDQPATCTEDGIKEQHCPLCNFTKKDTFKATGHKMVTQSRTEPSYESEGKQIDVCSTCGYEHITKINKLIKETPTETTTKETTTEITTEKYPTNKSTTTKPTTTEPTTTKAITTKPITTKSTTKTTTSKITTTKSTTTPEIKFTATTKEVRDAYNNTLTNAKKAGKDADVAYDEIREKLVKLNSAAYMGDRTEVEWAAWALFDDGLWENASTDEIQDMAQSALKFIVSKDDDKLSALMKKFKTMKSVKGTIESTKIDIVVTDMNQFVKEMGLRADVVGGVLAMLNTYDYSWIDTDNKKMLQFTENGFTFKWKAVGDYKMKLN